MWLGGRNTEVQPGSKPSTLAAIPNPQLMFYFNTDKFDFWVIYDSIKRFYPIGIGKDETKMFQSYPGMADLESIIVDKIHNKRQLKKWNDFTKQIETGIHKPIHGTTYGQAPCFSSYVELDNFSHGNFIRTKELHFFVSLAGPFYSIVGQDINTVRVGDNYFKGTNYLTISPENEYASSFIFLCDQIEKHFKDYRFVPFGICKQIIEGLYVKYDDNNRNAVFNAIFNNHIDLNIYALGDDYYKSDDWIKDGYVDKGNGWTSYPPT